MTGFTREDCLGRNCRFLQGPKSEPQSVGVIQNTPAGVDCAVRITNYKKSGEAFEQLLALHPVLDTSDRYRFCFGIHYEITPALPLKTIVAKISKLIKTLPSKLYAAVKEWEIARVSRLTPAHSGAFAQRAVVCRGGSG